MISTSTKLKTNADLAEKLIKGVGKCLVKQKPFELAEQRTSEDVTGYLKALKCALKSIENTLEGSEFANIYKNFKPIIVRAANNMEVCIRNKSGTEQTE